MRRTQRGRRWSALAVTALVAGATTSAIVGPAVAASPSPIQAPALAGAQPISSQDRVYTADQTSNTVTVIDPANRRVLGTLALGEQRLGNVLGPQYLRDVDVHGLGFSRDGRYLDVVSVTTNSVTVIRTQDNAVISRTTVGRAAHEGFFSPDGKTVWVADRALSQLDIVDALHGGVVGHVATGHGPSKVLFSPDGRLAYVNHLRSASIDVISVASRKVVRRIGGLADVFSSDMALSPDGKQLWAAHKKVGKVSVVDLVHGTVSALTTGADTNHPAFVTGVHTSDVWLTVGGENVTKVYRTRPGTGIRLVNTIKSTGVEPHGIWPSPDNSTVYVVNEKSDSVDIMSTRTGTVTDTLRVGQEGQALVYVAGAVRSGSGTQHLGRQGLDQRVENADAAVEQSAGSAHITVREVKGTDMFQLSGQGLLPAAVYTAYGRRNSTLVPILSFRTDSKGGIPQALAFLRFFGVYDIQDVTVRPGTDGTGGPSVELTSAEPGDAVAAGVGVPGAGSPAEGAGFAINVKATTHDGVGVAVSEGLNIRHTELLGGPNPDFPGLVVTVDNDLTKPDGGIIKAGTNLTPLFNVAGTDDTPGAGVTIWAGWHVLESLAPGTKTLTVTATVTDVAGRRARTTQTYDVTSAATSGQALTPSPSDTSTVTMGGAGPELDFVGPERSTSVAVGSPPPTLTPKTGTLFFIQLDALDVAHHGIAVNENANGAGQIVDGTQIKAAGPNRNVPGLFFTFDVPLRQPNGNVVPAGQNLAPLFNVAGSAVAPNGAVRTTLDWVVGGSLVLPPGQTSLTMTATVTDRAGGTSTITRRVGISPVTSGQDLTPQPGA